MQASGRCSLAGYGRCLSTLRLCRREVIVMLGEHHRLAAVFVLCSFLLTGAPATASPSPDRHCLLASGRAATKCVRRYTDAVATCRATADAACEAALRAPGGPLDELVAASEGPIRQECTDA